MTDGDCTLYGILANKRHILALPPKMLKLILCKSQSGWRTALEDSVWMTVNI